MVVDEVVKARLNVEFLGTLDLRVDFPKARLLKSESTDPFLDLPEEIDLILQGDAWRDLGLGLVTLSERHSDEEIRCAPARRY
jgi:hypothetical protein